MLDVALTLRSATTLVGRPAVKPSTESPPRVRAERDAIFRPLADPPADDLDRGDVAAVALLGAYRRFI
jgi:hypothetical protein